MTAILHRLVALFLLLPVLGGVAEARFSDDRVSEKRVAGTPMGAVGMVVREDAEGEALGTGFLVSPCHVLTAAHVLAMKHEISADQVVLFLAGTGRKGPKEFDANYFAESVKARPVAWGDYRSFDIGSTAERAAAGAIAGWNDWALLRLDRCLGDDGYGFFRLLPVSTRDFVRAGGSVAAMSAGLPADHGNEAVTVDPTCTMLGQVNSTGWQHDCTTMSGNSGGPILASEPLANEKWPRVLALHVINVVNNADGSKPNRIDPLAPDYLDALGTAVPVSAFLSRIAQYLPPDPVVTGYLARQGEGEDHGYDAGSAKDAVEDLTAALARQPRSPVLLTRRGQWLQAADDMEAALADYGAALSAEPDFAPALYDRALLRAGRDDRKMKDRVAARADLDQLLERFPDNTDLRIIRGSLLSGEFDYRAALADFDKVVKDEPENLSALLSRAGARMELGLMRGAGDDYDRAVRLEPDRAAVYIERASFRIRAGDRAGAYADLEKALGIEPGNPSALGARATIRLDEGNLAAARDDIDQAIALDPESGVQMALRGTIREIAGDVAGAIDDYRKAGTLDATEPFDDLLLFVALAESGRMAEGRDTLGALLKRWPAEEWPAPLARHLLGEIDEAELRAAAGTGNETVRKYRDFDLSFYLGATAMARGERDRARLLLSRVVDGGLSQFLEFSLARAFLARVGGPPFAGAD